jgi:hypothetical protein
MGLPDPTANNTVGRMNALLAGRDHGRTGRPQVRQGAESGQFKSHDYMDQLAEAEQAGV